MTINEMALPLKIASQKIRDKSEVIFDHLLKCVIYKNETGSFNHWITEIATQFSYCDNLKIKSKSGKLSEDAYYKALFSDTVADEESDMKFYLSDFQLQYCYKTHKYPDFEITDKLCHEVWTTCSRIYEGASNLMSSQKDHTLQQYKEFLEQSISHED